MHVWYTLHASMCSLGFDPSIFPSCRFVLCLQEEKLEPVLSQVEDPRIRLLNRLYARKRKELQERRARLRERVSSTVE